MRDDVNCPYCGEPQEINHDDGQGYAEDQIHQQECGECGKTFVFTTSISYSYEVGEAPCLNDGEHDWKVDRGYPSGYLSNWHTCKCCGEREIIDNTLKYDNDKDVWIKKEETPNTKPAHIFHWLLIVFVVVAIILVKVLGGK